MMQMMMVWPDFTTSVHVQCVNFTYVLVVLLQYARDMIFDLDQVVQMLIVDTSPLCIPYLCRDKCIIQMICIVQVILEHLPFVSESILVCAFETERVLGGWPCGWPLPLSLPRPDLGDGLPSSRDRGQMSQ